MAGYSPVRCSGRRCAGALLAALVIAGCGGGSHTPAHPATKTTAAVGVSARAGQLAVAVARVEAELRGIPQHGLVLGRNGAAVTITEYGEIDCALCAVVHNSVLPAVIARYVRSGRATLELRPVVETTLSHTLAIAAYATSDQGRGWDFVQLAYRRSRPDTGAPAESSPTLVGALGVNLARWRADLHRPQWQLDIHAALEVAGVAGFATYPVFLVRRSDPASNGAAPAPFIVLGAPQNLAAFSRAIAKALAGRA